MLTSFCQDSSFRNRRSTFQSRGKQKMCYFPRRKEPDPAPGTVLSAYKQEWLHPDVRLQCKHPFHCSHHASPFTQPQAIHDGRQAGATSKRSGSGAPLGSAACSPPRPHHTTRCTRRLPPAGRMPPSCGMIAASERPIALSPLYTSTGLLHITQVGMQLAGSHHTWWGWMRNWWP